MRRLTLVSLIILLGASAAATWLWLNPAAPTQLECVELAADADPQVAQAIRNALQRAQGGTDAASLAHLAMVYHANGFLVQAIEAYKAAIARDAKNPKLHYGLAHAYAQRSETDRALEAIGAAIALHENYPPMHRQQGFWLLDVNEVADARRSFERAIELDGSDVGAHVGLVRAMIEAREFDLAANRCAQIMSASHPEAPYLPYIAQLRATADRGIGKPVQAMDNLGANAGADLQWSDPWAEEVLALKTGYLHTIELVEALIAAGRPEQAIAKIAEITEHKPNDPGALNYHAGALFRMKRFDEGIAILQGLLQIDPDHYATNLNIARGYERVGKTELALQHIQRSLEVNPDFAEGHFRHGRLLLQMGRSPEAIESLKQAIRLNPSDLNAKMLLSETYIKRAEWAEAQAVLADIVSSHPRLADAHLNLGVACAELGQFEQANESVNRALECGTDAAKAHAITARIRQLQSNPKVDSAQ